MLAEQRHSAARRDPNTSVSGTGFAIGQGDNLALHPGFFWENWPFGEVAVRFSAECEVRDACKRHASAQGRLPPCYDVEG